MGPVDPKALTDQQGIADTFQAAGLLPGKVDVPGSYSTKLNPAIEAAIASYRAKFAANFAAPTVAGSPAAVGGRRVTFSAGGADRRRRLRVPSLVRRAIVPILLIALWQIGSSASWWSTEVLPAPWDVAHEFVTLWNNGQLPSNLWVSVRRALTGAAIGISVGLALGVAVGLWRPAEEALDATLQMMRTIPFLVTLPLFILWFGVDEAPKILIIRIGTALPMYINTMSGVRTVDPRLLEMGRQFGLNRLRLIATVVLPGATPSILTGVRYSLGLSWLALVVAEQINAQKGLGLLIYNAQSLFQTKILMVVVVYAALGLLTDMVVRLAERRLLAWRGR
ncbi:ABC-type nitrate/sulfonate/bicarbonate transport system, permease component [Frankia sp. QA3]|nr:ABC-type nitrate/sulfonate/bicarbonate transport system, permease component [Frankia sp. QA3]